MKQRVLTALLLAPVVVLALLTTAVWPITFLALICAGIAAPEVHRLVYAPEKGRKSQMWIGLILILLLTAGLIQRNPEVIPWRAFADIGLLATLLGIEATVQVRAGHLRALAPFTSLWLVGPLLCLISLHAGPWVGPGWNWHNPVVLAIVPLWGGDIAAIFVGKAFGKHPLAPAISPNKTWEGAIANFAACMIVTLVLGRWVYTRHTPWLLLVLCGLATGILGQIGDLFESWVKRQADIKDSGRLLPGHGGLMDRIDSLLFAAPIVALILMWKR